MAWRLAPSEFGLSNRDPRMPLKISTRALQSPTWDRRSCWSRWMVVERRSLCDSWRFSCGCCSREGQGSCTSALAVPVEPHASAARTRSLSLLMGETGLRSGFLRGWRSTDARLPPELVSTRPSPAGDAALPGPRKGAGTNSRHEVLVSRMINSGTMKRGCPESKRGPLAPISAAPKPRGAAEIGQRIKDSGH
jgi:hypothetical protein